MPDNNSDAERIAAQAIVLAMFSYTYGIVGDARGGFEGKGLGTGVGILWRNQPLILTAAHTLETTPYERMYFFLPAPALQIEEMNQSVDWSKVRIQRRHQLEKPHVLLDPDSDIAAVLLPDQPQAIGKRHFYCLDERQVSPADGIVVGFDRIP